MSSCKHEVRSDAEKLLEQKRQRVQCAKCGASLGLEDLKALKEDLTAPSTGSKKRQTKRNLSGYD